MTIAWEHGLIRAGGESPCGGRVIKFGGSLFRRGGWPAALRALVGRVVAPTTIVVGGGGLVEGGGSEGFEPHHQPPGFDLERLEHYARGSGAQSIYQGRVGLGEGHRANNAAGCLLRSFRVASG